MSAAPPTASFPAGRRKASAGPALRRASSVGKSSKPSSTSVIARGRSNSTLLMPGSVAPNGASLASRSWGWWWLEMAEITPDFTAARRPSRSARVRSGGWT
ncbi:hypothetical protein D3C84_665420 [compost metagenome]